MAFRVIVRRLATAASRFPLFKHLEVGEVSPFVVQVSLNRPDKLNALNDQLWTEIGQCFNFLSTDENCRAIVLCGAGKMFCSGMDLGGMSFAAQLASDTSLDVARRAFKFQHFLGELQRSFLCLEKCSKPIIAVIHGACIGGGVDLISFSDIRYCTADTYFQIKEVEMAITADVGSLQKLPKVVANDSLFRELVFTARKATSEEASKLNLVSQVFSNKDEMMEAATTVAATIASKSPVAVQGSKVHLNFSRDHSVEESLQFAMHWNMCMLQSEDVLKAISAAVRREKTPPSFGKL